MVNCVIGSGIFGLPSQIAALVGRASPLAYLAAALVAGTIMACFAEVASRFTSAGGPYIYARTAFGSFVGLLVGWLLWLTRVTGAAANANLFATYLGQFFPAVSSDAGRMILLTALIGFLAAINLIGVKTGTVMSNVFTVAKLLPLLTVVLLGGAYLFTHPAITSTASAMPEAAVPAANWLRAVLLLLFAYGGFEAALIPMGEARDPRRDAPLALFVSLGVCTFLYTAVQFVVTGVLADPAHAARPVAAAAQVFLGPAGASFIAIAVLISTYGITAANTVSNPRILFAMSESGDLPAWLSRISRRFQTPYVAILVYSALLWVLSVAGSFRWNATLSAVARLFAYAICCAALLQFRRLDRQREQPDLAPAFRLPFGEGFAVLAILLLLVLATNLGRDEWLALAIIAVIAIANWLWVRQRSRVSS